MSKKFTIERLRSLFTQHRPRTIGDMRKLLPLKIHLISEGHFRDIYAIKQCGAIIKIPEDYTPQKGDVPSHVNPLIHSQKEIDRITEINTKPELEHLRRYLPQLIYADRKRGIIVMKQYFKKRRERFRLQERILVRMFRDTLKMYTADYGRKNLLRDENDEPIVVDLGY